MKTYFALDITNSMLNTRCWAKGIVRTELGVQEAKRRIDNGVALCFCPGCCNKDVIKLMKDHYNIDIPNEIVEIGEHEWLLEPGNSILVLDVDHLKWFAEGNRLGENPSASMGFVEYRMQSEQASTNPTMVIGGIAEFDAICLYPKGDAPVRYIIASPEEAKGLKVGDTVEYSGITKGVSFGFFVAKK